MVPALLTSLLFSFSGVCASRSTRLLGPLKANFFRLLLAFFSLMLYAYVWGQGHQGPGLIYFLWSGAIGVGLGDIATFLSIQRVGPRVSVMLVQCLTAPIGAALEWAWMGTTLTAFQLLGGFIILCGSTLALSPDQRILLPPRLLRDGVIFGVLGATGQALGAVLTRKANELNRLQHLEINGMTAAYQRLLGAVAIAIVIYLLAHFFARRRPAQPRVTKQSYHQAAPWVVFNALSGLVLGISCYQWALQTTATGIVLSLVATTPLVVMPLAYWLDNDRPTRRAMLGAVVAVAGVLILQVSG
jgi:drug/metabolite transporter (DMT)-like permease